MFVAPDAERTRFPRTVAVHLAIPLALCGLLLTGCTGGDGTTSQPGSTSQEGGVASDDDGSAESPDDGAAGEPGDGEVNLGGIGVGTTIPDDFPDDLPLPEKAPTSVVTVGEGLGKVGGGVSLNYDGVSREELDQLLKDAGAAGYRVDGPFETGSSSQWGLRKDTTGVLVLFSDDANLSMTVTSAQ